MKMKITLGFLVLNNILIGLALFLVYYFLNRKIRTKENFDALTPNIYVAYNIPLSQVPNNQYFLTGNYATNSSPLSKNSLRLYNFSFNYDNNVVLTNPTAVLTFTRGLYVYNFNVTLQHLTENVVSNGMYGITGINMFEIPYPEMGPYGTNNITVSLDISKNFVNLSNVNITNFYANVDFIDQNLDTFTS